MKLVKITHDIEFTVKIKYNEVGEVEDSFEVPSQEELFENVVEKMEIAFSEVFDEELHPNIVVKKYDIDVNEMLNLEEGSE